MKNLLPMFVWFSLMLLVGAPAQTIFLKTGQSMVAKNIKRNGATLSYESTIGAGMVTLTMAIADIDHVEFPDANIIPEVKDLLLQGKGEQALGEITPFANEQETYKGIRGNMLSEASFLKAKTLIMLSKPDEATSILRELADSNSDQELVLHSKLLIAKLALDKLLIGKTAAVEKSDTPKDQVGTAPVAKGSTETGDAKPVADLNAPPPLDPEIKISLESINTIIKQTSDPEILGDAWLYKGQAYAALKDHQDAVLALLHVPALFTTSSAMPIALLTGAMELDSLGDQNSAKIYLDDLISKFPSTGEAEKAKVEVRRIENIIKYKKEKSTTPS